MTKVCTNCNTRKPLSEFYVSCSGKHGRMATCKECCRIKASTSEAKFKAKERANRHRQKEGYKEKHASYQKTPKSKLYLYQKSAEKKGLEFELTLEILIKSFWKKPCHYCGDQINTIGVDRIDNRKGYIQGNMTPCCSTCNYMKGTLSREEFLRHCTKIYQFNQTRTAVLNHSSLVVREFPSR